MPALLFLLYIVSMQFPRCSKYPALMLWSLWFHDVYTGLKKVIGNCNYYFVWYLLEVCLPKYTFTNVCCCCIFEKLHRWFQYYLYSLPCKFLNILVWYSPVWIGTYCSLAYILIFQWRCTLTIYFLTISVCWLNIWEVCSS